MLLAPSRHQYLQSLIQICALVRFGLGLLNWISRLQHDPYSNQEKIGKWCRLLAMNSSVGSRLAGLRASMDVASIESWEIRIPILWWNCDGLGGFVLTCSPRTSCGGLFLDASWAAHMLHFQKGQMVQMPCDLWPIHLDHHSKITKDMLEEILREAAKFQAYVFFWSQWYH